MARSSDLTNSVRPLWLIPKKAVIIGISQPEMTEGHTGTGILWPVKPQGGIGSVAQDLQPFAYGIDEHNLHTGGTSGIKSHRRACLLLKRLFLKNNITGRCFPYITGNKGNYVYNCA